MSPLLSLLAIVISWCVPALNHALSPSIRCQSRTGGCPQLHCKDAVSPNTTVNCTKTPQCLQPKEVDASFKLVQVTDTSKNHVPLIMCHCWGQEAALNSIEVSACCRESWNAAAQRTQCWQPQAWRGPALQRLSLVLALEGFSALLHDKPAEALHSFSVLTPSLSSLQHLLPERVEGDAAACVCSAAGKETPHPWLGPHQLLVHLDHFHTAWVLHKCQCEQHWAAREEALPGPVCVAQGAMPSFASRKSAMSPPTKQRPKSRPKRWQHR